MNANDLREFQKRFPLSSSVLARNSPDNRIKVPPAEPEHNQAPALVEAISGTTESSARPTVRFVFYRQRLLDRESAWAGTKDLLDGLRYAALIQNDAEKDIELQVEQVKVDHRAEQKTVVIITYP